MHRFHKCSCTLCGVHCIDQRSPDHTSDELDTLIMHFTSQKHKKRCVDALQQGKEHVQAYQNWRGEEVHIDHTSLEVWLGGKSWWSPQQSGKHKVNWSLWQKITNARLKAAGKAPKQFASPSDWGDGTSDEGVLLGWGAAEQSPGSSFCGVLSKSVQGQTEIQPQRLHNVLKTSITQVDKLAKGEGPQSIELPSTLSPGQRAQLHKRAAKKGLKTESRGPAEERIMCVWRETHGNACSRSPRSRSRSPRSAMQAELAELSYSALVTRATQECIEATTISSSETSDNLKQCKAALIAIIMEKKHFGIWADPQ